jgi:hypothetical protein
MMRLEVEAAKPQATYYANCAVAGHGPHAGNKGQYAAYALRLP